MIKREAQDKIKSLAEKLPVITITGPRQSGKTTLVRYLFPGYPYYNLENPDTRAYAEEDPRSFLQSERALIIDEVQYVPSLLSYMQQMVDEEKRPGQFILTGSQNLTLAQSVSQSLAGRSAMFQLLPLSITELQMAGKLPDHYVELVYRGGYPRLYDWELQPGDWMPDYIQNYLERDVRQLVNVQNLSRFQAFLKLCAGRCGQLLNRSALAGEVGVDDKTIQSWLSVLEASYIVFLLRPHFRNYGKRLVKTPKLYFYDTGLACSLLGIQSADQLSTHYLKGELFESMIISEIYKAYYNRHQRPEVYFWRDNTGHEVDALLEEASKVKALEIKSGATLHPRLLDGLKFFAKIGDDTIAKYLVYGGEEVQNRQGVQVLSWKHLLSLFD